MKTWLLIAGLAMLALILAGGTFLIRGVLKRQEATYQSWSSMKRLDSRLQNVLATQQWTVLQQQVASQGAGAPELLEEATLTYIEQTREKPSELPLVDGWGSPLHLTLTVEDIAPETPDETATEQASAIDDQARLDRPDANTVRYLWAIWSTGPDGQTNGQTRAQALAGEAAGDNVVLNGSIKGRP